MIKLKGEDDLSTFRRNRIVNEINKLLEQRGKLQREEIKLVVKLDGLYKQIEKMNKAIK